MYVRGELQAETRPVIISHGFGSGFNSEYVWAGNIGKAVRQTFKTNEFFLTLKFHKSRQNGLVCRKESSLNSHVKTI